MKTTNLVVSLLSLSLMVPGFTVLLSGTADAQNQACPRGYIDHSMGRGEELRFIAKQYTGLQKNWIYIINPTTKQPFSKEDAKNLSEGDVVCIPQQWQQRR